MKGAVEIGRTVHQTRAEAYDWRTINSFARRADALIEAASARESWRRIFGIGVRVRQRPPNGCRPSGRQSPSSAAPGSPRSPATSSRTHRPALSDSGFAVISGGGPASWKPPTRAPSTASPRRSGLNIQLPHEQQSNHYQDVSQTFRHFFARKYMFVRCASAYVVMPGGFGTLDELLRRSPHPDRQEPQDSHHHGLFRFLGWPGGLVSPAPGEQKMIDAGDMCTSSSSSTSRKRSSKPFSNITESVPSGLPLPDGDDAEPIIECWYPKS